MDARLGAGEHSGALILPHVLLYGPVCRKQTPILLQTSPTDMATLDQWLRWLNDERTQHFTLIYRLL